jgi:hypothetical protein
MPSLHYQTDLTFVGDEPDPHDVAQGAWGVFGTQFLALCPPTFTVQDVLALEEVLKPDVPTGGSYLVNTAGTLSVSNTNEPKGVVPIINLRTGISSRSARGHCALPGPIDTGAFAGGKWNSIVLAAYNAFAAKLDDSFDLGTIDITHVHPVIYSRTRRARGDTPWTFRVTSAAANPTPHWLRSRMSSP